MNKLSKCQTQTIFLVCIFIILSLIGSWFPGEWSYGFDHWKYFSNSSSIIFAIIVCLTFIPKINELISKTITSVLSKKKTHINKYLLFIVISIIFFLIFWNLKTVMLYGDATATMERLEGGSFLMTNVLTDYTYQGADIILQNFGFNSYLTIAFVNCLAGAIFIFFSLLIVSELGKTKIDKVFMFLLLCTMGSTAIFYGHIETYSLLAAGITIYIYTSIMYLNKKCSILWPGLLASITFMFHMSGGVLFPSLIALFFIKPIKGQNKWFNKRMLKLILSYVGPLIILFLIIFSLEWGFEIPENNVAKYGRFAQAHEGFWGGFYSLTTITHPTSQRFTMFSLGHLNEVFNEYMLISPVGLILFLIIFLRKDAQINHKEPTNIFFWTLLITYFIYTFIRVSAFGQNDWDHFAPISIIYTLFAAYLFTRVEKRTYVKKYLLLVLITVSLFHVLPWIFYNAHILF